MREEIERFPLIVHIIGALCVLVVGTTFIVVLFYSSPEPKLVSDRLSTCEDLGGKYTLRWSDLKNEYYERCDIPGQEIYNF